MTEKNPYFASTFAERKAIRLGKQPKQESSDDAETKQVDAETDKVEDKAVASKKATRKRTAKKA